MSSHVREVEHRSASACDYETASSIAARDDGWTLLPAGGDDDEHKHNRGERGGDDNHGDDGGDVSTPSSLMTMPAAADGGQQADAAAGVFFVGTESQLNAGDPGSAQLPTGDADADAVIALPCVSLAAGTTIRVSPMERSCGGWDDEHFSDALSLPAGSNAGRGMVVMFEAIGRECIAIALSPESHFKIGKTFVVHFGANGNLSTVLRRRINAREAVDASFPGRVCGSGDKHNGGQRWIPYWIVLQGGRLSAGMGRVPGRRCLGTLDDSMYEALRSGVDAARYVGVGNSSLSRNARDVRFRNIWVMAVTDAFGTGSGGVPVEEPTAWSNVLDEEAATNGYDDAAPLPTDARLLAEYERECAKAQARAKKFGVTYKQPKPDAFLRWSEARRLRANPERGFATGVDVFSPEERAKAESRKERFAREAAAAATAARGGRKRTASGDGEGEEEMLGEDEIEDMEDGEDAENLAEWENAERDPLPAERAWDNWELVQQFRVDPPPNMFAPDGNANDGEGRDVEGHVDDGSFLPKEIVPVLTKVHLFAIDWAAFKQIRTDDVMAYFKDYGPSYVEWLGELSCNVLFEDRHSAARAFRGLSQELLTCTPPSGGGGETEGGEDSENDNGTEGAELEESENDKGMEGAKLEHYENAEDGAEDLDEGAEGDNEGTAMVDGSKNGMQDDDAADGVIESPDFGMMGWRFCKWTIQKVSNDRFGRRGTRARLLMRLATSADILDDRPTEWPEPPPGFTTKRVLGPGSDFPEERRRRQKQPQQRQDESRREQRRGRGRKNAKRRRRGGGGREVEREPQDGTEEFEGEHPLLSKALSRAPRGGFSIEELEAERAAKREAMAME